MRSDNVKKHMKRHLVLSLEDPKQICKNIDKEVTSKNTDVYELYKLH